MKLEKLEEIKLGMRWRSNNWGCMWTLKRDRSEGGSTEVVIEMVQIEVAWFRRLVCWRKRKMT